MAHLNRSGGGNIYNNRTSPLVVEGNQNSVDSIDPLRVRNLDTGETWLLHREQDLNKLNHIASRSNSHMSVYPEHRPYHHASAGADPNRGYNAFQSDFESNAGPRAYSPRSSQAYTEQQQQLQSGPPHRGSYFGGQGGHSPYQSYSPSSRPQHNQPQPQAGSGSFRADPTNWEAEYQAAERVLDDHIQRARRLTRGYTADSSSPRSSPVPFAHSGRPASPRSVSFQQHPPPQPQPQPQLYNDGYLRDHSPSRRYSPSTSSYGQQPPQQAPLGSPLRSHSPAASPRGSMGSPGSGHSRSRSPSRLYPDPICPICDQTVDPDFWAQHRSFHMGKNEGDVALRRPRCPHCESFVDPLSWKSHCMAHYDDGSAAPPMAGRSGSMSPRDRRVSSIRASRDPQCPVCFKNIDPEFWKKHREFHMEKKEGDIGLYPGGPPSPASMR